MFEEFTTFREIDESIGQPKGTAFRCFKSHLGELTEGQDFRVLSNSEDGREIALLKTDNRVYAQSHNIVLLSIPAAEQIKSWLGRQSF